MCNSEEEGAVHRNMEAAPDDESGNEDVHEEEISTEGDEDVTGHDEDVTGHDEEDDEETDDASDADSSEEGDDDIIDNAGDDSDDSDDDETQYAAARRAAWPKSATQVRFEELQRQQEHERFMGVRLQPQPQPPHDQPSLLQRQLQQSYLQLFQVQEQLLRQQWQQHRTVPPGGGLGGLGGSGEDARPLRQALGLGVQRLRPRSRLDGGEDGGPNGDGERRWVVTIDSESIEHAVDDLEHATGDEIEHLVVSTNLSREDWIDEVVANHPECFRRLVELLGEPGRIIRSVKFGTVIFDLDTGIRAADLEQLFGTTLPLHPTLRKIEFERCFIPYRYFDMLTSSLPSATQGNTTTVPTKELVLEGGMQQGWMIAADRVRSIAGMVGRNARVHSLALTTDWQGFEPDVFQQVCSGLHDNTNLRTLSMDLQYIPEDTFDVALAPTSPLEVLHITRGALSGFVTPSLARLLTSNATLVELEFAERVGNDSDRDEDRLNDIATALETSNFTLQKFSEGTAISEYREHCHHHLVANSRIGKCLRRNVWIHRVLPNWPEYRVPFTGLWPTVLQKADSCPTLLYRFLRRGNLPVLCDVVVGRRGNDDDDDDDAVATQQHPARQQQRGANKRKVPGE